MLVLRLCQKLLWVQNAAPFDHGSNLPRVPNVGQRITVNQDEICELAHCDRPNVVLPPKSQGCSTSRSVERLCWRQPRNNQHFELAMKGEAGNYVGERGIRAGHYSTSGSM